MSEEEMNEEEFSAENIRELKIVLLLGAISEFGRRKLTKYINYLEDELQVYKDKYSDLETDYAKSVENEKTLRYTVNKYYDELQAYKDKEDRLRELLKNNTLKNIKCDCNCLRNFVGNIEQILNEGDK